MKRTLLFLSFIFGVAFNLFAATGTYITDVAVSASSDEDEAKSALTKAGYRIIDKDANAGAGKYTDFIYIGYKTNEDEPNGKPICDLLVYDDGIFLGNDYISYHVFTVLDENNNDIDYYPVKCLGESNGDLNQGCADSHALFLYCARSGAPAITDIGLSKSKNTDTDNYIAQMVKRDNLYGYAFTGEDADLNLTAGGEDLWLWFHRPDGEVVQEHTWVNGFCTECDAYQKPTRKNTNEYQITNAGNLYWYIQNAHTEVPDAKAVVTTNITINSNVLTTSGTLNTAQTNSFRKWILSKDELVIEGNNYTISGVYFKDATVDYVGLLAHGMVSNLKLKDSYFEGANYVGAFCGEGIATRGKITNCSGRAVVKGKNYVGGVCGECNMNLTDCHGTFTVTGEDYVGGICGRINQTENCYSEGTVQGKRYVGGICGMGVADSCYNLGKVSGNSKVGGIAGVGAVIHNGTDYGAVYVHFCRCHNEGEVSGNEYVGGICAYGEGGLIKECFNRGSIVGVDGEFPSACIGGISGEGLYIINCYNLGAVSGHATVGGLAGSGRIVVEPGDIRNSYNMGTVKGSVNCGNIVGGSSLSSALDLSSCYYLSSLALENDGNAKAMSSSDIKNGELAFRLHHFSITNYNGSVWGQKLGTDDYPTFRDMAGTFSVTLDVDGDGTVTGAGTYAFGDSVRLVATPDKNKNFRGWSDGVMDPVRYVHNTTDLTATFSPSRIVVYVESDGNGTVTGEGVYDDREKFTIEAQPAENYRFDRWTFKHVAPTKTFDTIQMRYDNSVIIGTENMLYSSVWTIMPDLAGNKVVGDTVWFTAHFVLADYNISAEVEGEGEVTGTGAYPYGTTATLTATPKEEYHFVKWSDGETSPSREVVVTCDSIFTAIFEPVIVDPTVVSDILADDEIVEVVYYNVSGQRLARPQIGVNIVLVRYQSGRIESVKQIVRE